MSQPFELFELDVSTSTRYVLPAYVPILRALPPTYVDGQVVEEKSQDTTLLGHAGGRDGGDEGDGGRGTPPQSTTTAARQIEWMNFVQARNDIMAWHKSVAELCACGCHRLILRHSRCTYF